MKVVFHSRYKEVYASDPAAAQGRLDKISEELGSAYEFVQPSPASEQDILLVHTSQHLHRIKQRSHLYELALLAAGGAILASEIALEQEPAFGLIRPPGHHASPDSCWGFCWFNNIAIAIEKMKQSQKIHKALIVDIDLHFGDGTNAFFSGDQDVTYHHLDSMDQLRRVLDSMNQCDMVGISAGFDRHVQDWGGMLTTEDYLELGKTIGGFASDISGGKVFAVLEGGYNHDVLGQNALALLRGLES